MTLHDNMLAVVLLWEKLSSEQRVGSGRAPVLIEMFKQGLRAPVSKLLLLQDAAAGKIDMGKL